MSVPKVDNSTDGERDRGGVEYAPVVPNERDAWIGMAATLVLCLVVAVIYFWASGAHGR